MDTSMHIESKPVPSSTGAKQSTFKWMLLALPFAWLWFHLIDNLRLQWVTDPQYSFGLVVPLLTSGLLMRRWQRYSKVPLPAGELNNSTLLVGLAVLAALFYLPTRLIEEATP